MNPSENIEKNIKKTLLHTTPQTDDSILTAATEALKNAPQASIDKPGLWRTISKNRTVKLTAAVAAVILLIILIMQNGSLDIITPAFALSDIVDAMQNTQWMHSTLEIVMSDPDDPSFKDKLNGPAQSWQSVNPVRTAIKFHNGAVEFSETEAGYHSAYDPDTNTITETISDPSQINQTATDAGQMLIQQITGLEKRGAIVKFTDEVFQGRDLTLISIDYSREGDYKLKMSLWVDPKTSLPVKMVADQSSSKAGKTTKISGSFEYPDTGPTDIYQVGAPRDAIVKTIDKRSSPEFLEAIQPYDKARGNLPEQRIVIDTESNEKGNVSRICVVYTDGRKERFQERRGLNKDIDVIPSDENFRTMVDWAYKADADSIGVQLYDGEYKHKARRDYEKRWSVSEPEYSPDYCSRSYVGGLLDRAWPRMTRGNLIRNDYAEQNGLIAIEVLYKATFKDGKLSCPAERIIRYLDPVHDYMCIRQERFQYRIEPHDEPIEPDQLDFNPQETPSQPYSITEVTELGQLDTEHWLPKKIKRTNETWRNYGNGWESYADTTIISLYVQPDPQFPQGIFEPDNLIPPDAEIRQHGTKTAFQREFDAAIAVIDSRQYWPGPAELVKLYWQAKAAGDYEETAILWPGSASWQNDNTQNQEPIEYVFGEPKKAGSTDIIVPYSSKDYYRQHQSYNLKMWLTNKKSSKGRYYIISGN